MLNYVLTIQEINSQSVDDAYNDSLADEDITMQNNDLKDYKKLQ